ncbi:MAG: MFS transporter [Candidatus Rokubacteria bacterium]|nr:MFS transporter [Candidatus Rokubacteria bacterium]
MATFRDPAPPGVLPPAPARTRPGAWPALALVTAAHGAGSFAMLSVAPLAPFLVDALGLTRAQVGLFLPAAYLGGVLMALPAGWLTDWLGVRLTLALGLAVIGVMVVLAALGSSLAVLLPCLVVGGFGFSVLNPATGKAIVDWFPARRRGAAMGIKQTGLTLGGVAASLTLPPVAAAFGWHRALVVAAAVALVSGGIVALAYRHPPLPEAGTPPARPRVLDAMRFLRRPGVLLVFACGFVLSVAQSSLLGYLALYAKETFVVSAVGAGQLLALSQVGGTASRLAWGFVSDRWFGGRRRPGIVVNALLAAMSYVLLSYGARLPDDLLVPLAIVAGAGAFGWVGLYFALVAEIGGPRYAGVLTGLSVIFAWGGTLFGPPLFGHVLDATDGYTASWLILAALAAAVAVALPWPKPLVQRD